MSLINVTISAFARVSLKKLEKFLMKEERELDQSDLNIFMVPCYRSSIRNGAQMNILTTSTIKYITTC